MSKVLRLALPVFLAGVLAVALGSTPAQANCPFDALITMGVYHSTLDEPSCGTTPNSTFWLIHNGNPVIGAGYDNGIFPSQVNPFPDSGNYWTSNWGESGVDGCPVDTGVLQADGTLGPMAVYIVNGADEGTPAHGGNYVLLSADLDEIFQFYQLDIINNNTDANVTCAPLPVPVIDSFAPHAGGGFDVTMHWGGITNALNDCATNPSITTGDCAGGTRNLLSGWAVYSKEAECLIGPSTGDRSAWTLEASVAAGANAGTTVTIQGSSGGLCRFVAVNPLFDAHGAIPGMQGQFLSGHAGPINTGTGDTDGDGILDFADNCRTVYNPGQADADGDLVGDACDNCWSTPNQNQLDSDGDCSVFSTPYTSNPMCGDACDVCPTDASNDVDGDGFCGGVDNCPTVYNNPQTDSDSDGLGDACDTCPLDPDNDADGDGICGNLDDCPNNYDPAQADSDGDGHGDACDVCPYEKEDPAFPGADKDGDGICSCDAVLGNAGLCPPGTYDNCPRTANPTQASSGKGDGLGSACEDRFGAVQAIQNIAAGDQGFGDCRIRFQTLNEWNCPKFRIIYRSPGGDRDNGIGISCSHCTDGLGRALPRYPNNNGAYIKFCHGGHDMYVQAVRSNPNSCSLVLPNAVTAVKIEKVASRIRL